MTLKLEVGMMAVCRDGERVGPLSRNDGYVDGVSHPYRFGLVTWASDGKADMPTNPANDWDIIATGYPWTELSAQVGDTVRCVWSGWVSGVWDQDFISDGNHGHHEASLYVIVKRAVVPVAPEPEIKWGDWVGTDVPARDMDTCELRIVKGIIVAHRLPKPPVVQEHFQYSYCFGVDHKIKLTKVGNVTTVEIVK